MGFRCVGVGTLKVSVPSWVGRRVGTSDLLGATCVCMFDRDVPGETGGFVLRCSRGVSPTPWEEGGYSRVSTDVSSGLPRSLWEGLVFGSDGLSLGTRDSLSH